MIYLVVLEMNKIDAGWNCHPSATNFYEQVLKEFDVDGVKVLANRVSTTTHDSGYG